MQDEKKFRRIQINDDEEWHRVRRTHLQASEAAAVLGISPWQNPCGLYDIKVGAVKEPDIGSKPYVQYGKAMEEHLRAMFALDLPYFKVEYHRYDILESIERPWQGCTLDAELTVVRDNPWDLRLGEKGIYEAKTGSFRGWRQLQEWEGQIPDHYYGQVIHQLSVTGWGFTIVDGRLLREPFKEEDLGFPEIQVRRRLIKVDDKVREDIDALNEAETRFWEDHVMKKRRPPLRVTL